MNASDFVIEFQKEPHQRDQAVLLAGIIEEARVKRGMEPIAPFGFFVRDKENKVIGGATGHSYYGCLYIDMLWVDSKFRGVGLGSKIMLEAENWGRERGAQFVTVMTMDWEAISFYEKLGYKVEFVREGYDKESKMYSLRKNFSLI